MEDNIAIAKNLNQSVSTKQTIEVCRMIRGKTVDEAKKMLQEVLKFKRVVPYKKFNFDLGHKKGHMGPGRYPQKAAKMVLTTLKTAEKNAEDKGLNVKRLFIFEIKANKGPGVWRYGRNLRRRAKRTHLEIVVKEFAEKKQEKDVQKQNKTLEKEEKVEVKENQEKISEDKTKNVIMKKTQEKSNEKNKPEQETSSKKMEENKKK